MQEGKSGVIMESNGSSSQASICASCLSLMAAGVPIKAVVSGIAMGLISSGPLDGKHPYTILTDIQGLEDHFGDMDFKCAGTENGLTALQMDIKIHGVTREVLSEALAQAHKARAEIEKILEKGKGCVAVSSHIGGWAIAGGELAQYPCPTGVIGVSAEHEYISKMEEAHRRRNLPKMIATADDPFAMLAGLGILRKNGVVSVHGDRYIAGKFASVDFLGKKARFPVSAYALAEKSGASIAIVFCTREKSGSYTISVSRTIEPSSLPGASFQERSSAYAQAYADDIAKTLKYHPYQWYNFYPFWLQ